MKVYYMLPTAIILFMASCLEPNETEVQNVNKISFVPDSIHSPEKDPDTLRITYSHGAGNCIGYCETTFYIHSWGITKSENGWASGGDSTRYPRKTKLLSIDSAEYLSLINSFQSYFWRLPETVGCPDCRDEGWEMLSVSNNGNTKSISFSYGASVPGLEPFLSQVRDITRN